jgi:hypothetical protein
MADHEAMLTDLEKQVSTLEGQIAGLIKSAEDDEAQPERFRLSKAKSPFPPEAEADAEDVAEGDEETFPPKAKKAAPKVEKAAPADDETVTIAGQTIAKSVVGDGPFAIFKAQAEELEKAKTDIAKERDLREMAELKKRADDEFAHVPGTVEERALMLKALAPLDPKVRKSFETVMTQAEKLSKAAFETLGHKGGKTEVNGDFEKKVAEIRKRDNCSRVDALSKARTEHPDEYAQFQDSAN